MSRIYDMNNLMRQINDGGDGILGNQNLRNSNYVHNAGIESRLNFELGGNQNPSNTNALFHAPKQTSSILNLQQQILNNNNP